MLEIRPLICCTLIPERLGLVRRYPSLEGGADEDGEPCPEVETPLKAQEEGNAENEAGDLEEEGLPKVHGHFPRFDFNSIRSPTLTVHVS